MPSTATITSFYTFTANTKARATHVNTNFSNFRGHIVPIDPNTIAASNETYDLGSAEYRWKTGYFREVDFKSNTSTAGRSKFVGDTTGSIDVYVSGSTLGSFKSDGFTRGGIKKSQLYYSYGLTSSFADITNTATNLFTLSVTSNGHIALVGMNLIFMTIQPSMVYSGAPGTYIRTTIYRDGTGAANIVFQKRKLVEHTATVSSEFARDILFYDTSVTAGNHTYYLYLNSDSSATSISTFPVSDTFCFLELV